MEEEERQGKETRGGDRGDQRVGQKGQRKKGKIDASKINMTGNYRKMKGSRQGGRAGLKEMTGRDRRGFFFLFRRGVNVTIHLKWEEGILKQR